MSDDLAPAIQDATDPVVRDTLGRAVHDLRISVIDRCNFRCPYCMPEDQFHEHYEFFHRSEWLQFDEIERLARMFAQLGVAKLRLTGGEPLLRKGMPELIRRLAAIPGIEDLAMTTNGYLLAPHAAALREAGLNRVTVSLDSLDDAVFRHMCGDRGGPQRVLDGIAAATAAGLAPIKINVVVQRGVNDHTILDLLRHFRGSGHVVRFIEYMDVGNQNRWRMNEVVPSAELIERIGAEWPLEPVDRNYHGEVAERYAFADGGGELGFISSVTAPFCGACTRARLSTTGRLYTCLFAGAGTDLRTPMRNGLDDEGLAGLLAALWRARTDRYSEQRVPSDAEAHTRRKVEMYEIGG